MRLSLLVLAGLLVAPAAAAANHVPGATYAQAQTCKVTADSGLLVDVIKAKVKATRG